MKDYNAIRLKNGVRQAIEQGLADIAVAGLQAKINAYESGEITASEFIDYLDETHKKAVSQ